MGKAASRSSRGIIYIAAALMALALIVAPAASAGDLKRGSQGTRVAALQRMLGLKPDRIFGPGTKRAVKRFQRRHHLTADGIVGSATWSALKRARGSRAAPARRAAAAACACCSARSGSRPTGSSAPARARRQDLPARPRPDRRRRRRPRDLVGARPPGRQRRAQAAPQQQRRPVGSGLPIAVRRVIAAGDRIAHLPYRFGGGHASFNDSGYDCSGSVSYALHGGGLLDAPLDSGELMSYGEPGPGRWITIYAHGSHTYMVVRGRRFDTTGASTTGSRWQWDAALERRLHRAPPARAL